MASIMATGLLFVAALLFTAKRLLRYLRYFQQEEYNSRRFLSWVIAFRAFDRRGSLVVGAAAIFTLLFPLASIYEWAAAFSLFTIAYREEDPRWMGKVRLKMTERAIRLYMTAFAISVLILTSFLVSGLNSWIALLLLFQLVPFTLMIACLLLDWDEKRRQQQFMKEAKQILAEVDPFVIGITGSYGKTSTKHALAHLLRVALAPTFWTTKGINTPMGNTREIRSSLRPGHRYAVMEMGAYGKGSIERLCQLTPPHAAIITTIGTAHLERFKSEELIFQTKAELAQAVPSDGILVCNGDNEGARHIAALYPKRVTLLYGFDNEKGKLDCWISQWRTEPNGTHFTFLWKGKTYEGSTPLFGQSSLSNIAACFTMGCALGAQPELLIAAIANLEPVDNRLQLKREGEVIYLHDAYNSNPVGFASALDVAASLPVKRRLLMTPGMIELGKQAQEQHEKIGRKAASICDLTLIVGETNRDSLCAGLKAGGMAQENIFCCTSREEAFALLKKLRQEGDLILIENDLVDLYEAKPRF